VNINIHSTRIQYKLSKRVSVVDRLAMEDIAFVAGGDVRYAHPHRIPTFGSACFAVCAFPSMELVETAVAHGIVRFPYIPTYLSFRELPFLLRAYKKISHRVDAFLLDGQGIAHPRGLGLASHFGVVTGEVTVGCAKSWLFGDFREPEKRAGATSSLLSGHRRIGVVVRPRVHTECGWGRQLLFVSPGHNISVDLSLQVVRKCLCGHRLPEPIRFAHNLLAAASFPTQL